MFKRQTKIILKYSRVAIVLEVACWLLLAALLIYTMQMYGSLGETIAVSFDSHGAPIVWKAKAAALVHPIFAIFFYIVLTGAGIIIRRSVSPDEGYPILRRALISILCVKAIYLIYELAYTYFTMSQIPVPASLKILFGLAVLAVILLTIFSCIRCRKSK